MLSSLSTVPGAVVAYYALGVVHVAIPYAMALSAAKMTIPGDVALFSREEVEEIIARQGGDIRR